VLRGEECDPGESVEVWLLEPRGEPLSVASDREEAGDSCEGRVTSCSFTCVFADTGADLEVDEGTTVSTIGR